MTSSLGQSFLLLEWTELAVKSFFLDEHVFIFVVFCLGAGFEGDASHSRVRQSFEYG